MKYISVVMLLILLSWTWCLATSDRTLRLEEHRRVETGVEEDIRSFIKRRFPSTNDVFCNRLYTEVAEAPTDLIVHFRCQAISNKGQEDSAVQVYEGQLRLKSEDGFATWGETGGEIKAREVNFIDGIKVTPENTPESTPATPKKGAK